MAETKNSRIWDDIEAGRYKAAHKTCVRRIEKGETSDYLQVLRAHTLSLYATSLLSASADSSYTTGLADFQEASKLAKRLASRTVPFSDVDSLRLLHRVCEAQRLDAVLISGALERAAKARPKDLVLVMEWFNGCVKCGYWKGAQAAAMVLQKNWTGRREFFFWAAGSSWLLAKSYAEGSPERNLFGTLAYKMIIKAKNDTPEDTTVIPARAIQTVQELHLLISIVRDYGTDKAAAAREALEILNSKNLGVDSEIGKGDWWGLVRTKLDILEELNEWTKEREMCKTLLEESVKGVEKGGKTGKGDDWRVWEGLLKATEASLRAGASKEYAEKLVVDTREVIERHMEVDAKSRNVLLAGCYYAKIADSRDKSKRESEEPELLERLKRYFDQWGTKNCCFEDVRGYAELLNEKAQKGFLKYLGERTRNLKEGASDVKSKIAAVAAETNLFKFEYLLTLSVPVPKEPQPTSVTAPIVEALEIFAEKCLRLYQESLALGSSLLETDDQHGDDASLLAIMALTRAYHVTTFTTPIHIYKSLFQLDKMLEKSPHNYQAMLFGISLSLLIGAPNLASQYVPDLSIKQIQLDSMTHYFLSRISSLMPIPLSSRNPGQDTDVLPLLLRIEKFFAKAIPEAGEMQVFALERGTYSQCAGFLEFHHRLKSSLTRVLTAIDHHRIDRFRRAPHGTQIFEPHVQAIDPTTIPPNPSDNRDFKVLYSYESSKLPSFLHQFLTLGAPPPSAEYTLAFHAIEQLIESIRIPSPLPTIQPSIPLTLTHALENHKSQFTCAEIWEIQVAISIANAVQSQSKEDIQLLDGHLTSLLLLSTENIENRTKNRSGYQQLHQRNETLHILILVKLFLNIFEGNPKLRKRVGELGKKFKKVVEEVKKWEVSCVEEGMVEGWIGRWGDEEGQVGRWVEKVEGERKRVWEGGREWRWA